MNLDELQSVQARERQSSDLQHLRSSFYQEVGEFINDLNEKRARAVEEADDPFSEPEVRRLTDDIETAEGTVEAIYERRVGKVVKKASIAAAGMPIEDDGLTAEEEALFEDLVDRIESNRETVLSVLDGEAPAVSCSIEDEESSVARTGSEPATEQPAPETDPTPATDDGLSAADLMGEGTDAVPDSPPMESEPTSPPASEPEPTEPEAPSTGTETPGSEPTATSSGAVSTAEPGQDDRSLSDGRSVPKDDSTSSETDDTTRERSEGGKREVPGIPRTTVRITADIGEIVGADDRDYDLGSEDVVTLPEPNADVLIEKNAAERLQ
ncbi:MAG: hypothetical protein V5A36_05580 [Natronomonas sp.]